MRKLIYIVVAFVFFSCNNITKNIIYVDKVSISCEEVFEREDAVSFIINLKIENNSSFDVLLNVKDIDAKNAPFLLVTKYGDSIPVKINNRQSVVTIKTGRAYLAQANFSRALFWKSNKSNNASDLKSAKIVYNCNLAAIEASRKNAKLYTVRDKEIPLTGVIVRNEENPKYIPEIIVVK